MSVELEHVSGLRELQAALYQLPVNIAANVLRGSVLAGAAVVREQAKTNAPTYTGKVADGHPPPGTLKRAIFAKRIREKSNQFSQVFYVGVRKGKKYRKQGKGGNLSMDAYYASWVEFGHYYAPRGKHGLGMRKAAMNAVANASSVITGSRFILPHPYLRPAFEATKTIAVQRIKQYLTDRIPVEVEKLRRK